MHIVDRIIRVPYVWKALADTGLLKPRQNRDYQRLLRAGQEIDRRLALKKESGEKVNVVFVCHRPSIWPALRDLCLALKEDPLFRVQIVTVPQRNRIRGRGYFHGHFEAEGADEFWCGEGCLSGYDEQTGTWLDLRSLCPDYVFFQQPYNAARPDCLLSSEVSKYAKILYIPYFLMTRVDSVSEECLPVDFLRDLSFYFAQNEMEKELVERRLRIGGPNVCRIAVTGQPRLEHMRRNLAGAGECTLWHRPDSFRILWTPRWNLNEGNCHFFSYLEPLTAWCKAHDNVELMFRPHPQAFREWRAAGALTEEREKELREEFSRGNFILDESREFYPQMASSSVLLSDASSMMIDYYYTGKPLIECMGDGKKDHFLEVLQPGLYKPETWAEVEKVLDDLLAGNDPLLEARAKCAEEYLQTNGNDSTRKIHDLIRADALK